MSPDLDQVRGSTPVEVPGSYVLEFMTVSLHLPFVAHIAIHKHIIVSAVVPDGKGRDACGHIHKSRDNIFHVFVLPCY